MFAFLSGTGVGETAFGFAHEICCPLPGESASKAEAKDAVKAMEQLRKLLRNKLGFAD
jgi:hypothetical protein